MIVDSHLHFGTMGQFDLAPQKMLQAMESYGVGFGIVSNIAACEFEPRSKILLEETSQLEANRATVDLVCHYPSRLRGQFWIKPHSESFDLEIADFILKHRESLVGLKIHPYYSQLPVTDHRYKDYLEFANELGLPIAVHTAIDETSAPHYVHEIAKRYTHVPFIMVHMELGSDNRQAIELASTLDNLYLDTTWVRLESTLRAVQICGPDKILFGSDSPIDGVNTYDFYSEYFKQDCTLLSPAVWEKIMSQNALRLFGLPS